MDDGLYPRGMDERFSANHSTNNEADDHQNNGEFNVRKGRAGSKVFHEIYSSSKKKAMAQLMPLSSK